MKMYKFWNPFKVGMYTDLRDPSGQDLERWEATNGNLSTYLQLPDEAALKAIINLVNNECDVMLDYTEVIEEVPHEH